MLSMNTFNKNMIFSNRHIVHICTQLPPTDLSICLYFQLAEDVICHKADLRFVSISGQKVLDSIQAALEQVGGSDPAMNSTKQLVTDKLQDANHRYTNLHTKVRDTRVHSRNYFKLCSVN